MQKQGKRVMPFRKVRAVNVPIQKIVDGQKVTVLEKTKIEPSDYIVMIHEYTAQKSNNQAKEIYGAVIYFEPLTTKKEINEFAKTKWTDTEFADWKTQNDVSDIFPEFYKKQKDSEPAENQKTE